MSKLFWGIIIVVLMAFFGITTIFYTFIAEYSRATLHAIMFLISYSNLLIESENEPK